MKAKALIEVTEEDLKNLAYIEKELYAFKDAGFSVNLSVNFCHQPINCDPMESRGLNGFGFRPLKNNADFGLEDLIKRIKKCLED